MHKRIGKRKAALKTKVKSIPRGMAHENHLNREVREMPFPRDKEKFPIVAIGASAGGLEAFSKLITNLPLDTGMAFVLLQHLDPKQDSMSVEILSRVTALPVMEVKDGLLAAPNHIYVIPPNFSMGILHGILNLIPRSPARGQHLVIDFFFQSLAKDVSQLAIGVVLSGTGSDGTIGLQAIKAEGGITFAQTPSSAKYDSMPKSAIAAGVVDFELTPEAIAEELARMAHHPFARAPKIRFPVKTEPPNLDSLKHIFLLLRNLCHVDFTFYKSNTVRRRIERRMVLHHMDNLANYVELLAQDPSEVKALCADILIHVTSFFRDPEVFLALKKNVFPKLLGGHPTSTPLRVWVPGCSTGEEAYSIAISLVEYLDDAASHRPIQIFASDIGEQAIQKARLGEYPESIRDQVSPERLNRFFNAIESGGYKIAKSIRDVCLFSRHDFTVDPPFAKIDLISCRNVFIYFNSKLQKRILPVFHYSLKSGGFLWFGKSETIGGSSSLFSLVDKDNNFYTKTDGGLPLNLHFPPSHYIQGKTENTRERKMVTKEALNLGKIFEQALQEEYPGVLVNEEMEILQLRGRTAPYIEPASGNPSYQLFKMANPELVRDLRMTLQTAKKTGDSVRLEGLSLKVGRMRKSFNLNVIPIQPTAQSKTRVYLILFEKVVEAKSKRGKKLAPSNQRFPRGVKRELYIHELEQQLTSAHEFQTSMTEQFENAQEDLTTANEELQSANEELQSTNEELETAKEELQSGNEELTTVNDELQARSMEQHQTNNDLINLLGSVEIPIVMLSRDLTVRRFTPKAGKALNLIVTDVGRPLSDLKLNFRAPGVELDLEKLVADTISTTFHQELEVQDNNGRWFRLQIRPYKTIDNRIDGAVLALVDIDDLKLSLAEVRSARGEAERANRAKDLFIATLSHELRTPLSAILSWSEMLATGSLTPERIQQGSEIIQKSAKAQAQLINDLLDVSRIVSGKITLDRREVDLGTVIMAAIESMRPAADAKAIGIETFIPPHLETVFGDPLRLQQIFWNLISNAVKFSARESKVTIRVERIREKSGDKAQAFVKVSDSGKGIERDFLPKIFDSFSQEDNSSVRLHGGLGLGLAIVRNLVELHGGTVQAESLGPEKGAVFTVTLPLQIAVPSPQPNTVGSNVGAPDEEEATSPIRLDGIRTLVVDDQAHAGDAFGEILRSFGADVKVATSAQEGLALFALFKPHVLVSDIAMPGEDGYSLIRKIRALKPESGGNTPAIALTAYAGVEDIHRAHAAGFQKHLSKPIHGEDLARAISILAAPSNSRSKIRK